MSIQLIQQYYTKVEQVIRYGGSWNESSLRKPFQDLLEQYARSKNLVLVGEVEMLSRRGTRIRPDGVLKDALRQDWGYWESKDEKDDIEAEIRAKFNKGYPHFNILFEDTKTAVLFQGGEEVLRAAFHDAPALDKLLTRFVSYEPKEVTEFHKAIALFSAEVGGLAKVLREVIEEQVTTNPAFHTALNEFLELARKAINPKVEMADVREMVIQHVLTEDIFMRVFDEAEFHRENVIARKLAEVSGTFYKGDTKKNILARIKPYYETINARASQIQDHHEKQKFLKALYESFYKAYNPRAADRLGIVYTPEEIVRFMIESADHLVYKHFGKTLGDKGVEILDPATGTGTFITELIEYLPLQQLEYKYDHELHCNEVSILPYYIANLNIEYTYKQKTGKFNEFENICFVDTLDNMGFEHTGKQLNFFGITDENTERIVKQNSKPIMLVIGNPPYNDNQMNENQNNKNREYPEIDKRIKDTYIKNSSAQKTHLYDMYTRFLRWASDRIDKNGIVAFVSNSSFVDAKTYDGFRKVVAKEFSEIYIIDLKGNARTSGERRRKEGGNVFSDQIKVGVAVYFMIRKEGEKNCKVHYIAVDDYLTAEQKQDYLRENKLKELRFSSVYPDKKYNWINISDENDWDKLISITKIFGFQSPGVKTNRDDWVYDFNRDGLSQKIQFFIGKYNQQNSLPLDIDEEKLRDKLDYSIKWSSSLIAHLMRRSNLIYDQAFQIRMIYRPFVKMYYYSDKMMSDRLTANHYEMFGQGLKSENLIISLSGEGANKPFHLVASDGLVGFDTLEKTQSFPLYRYLGGTRLDNITDWALGQFQKHYNKKGQKMTGTSKVPVTSEITKQDIFHYIYAVLHHPAYRSKYEINLKREFPRIPFYEDFRQWAAWGKQLMDLHLHYETVAPYPLQRIDEEKNREQTPVTRLMARKEKGEIEVDTCTKLAGVPAEAWDYRLGTYSALEWILERYKEKKPKDPTIAEKFNTYRFADYKEQVIDLLGRVCTVSVETMRIIREMP